MMPPLTPAAAAMPCHAIDAAMPLLPFHCHAAAAELAAYFIIRC